MNDLWYSNWPHAITGAKQRGHNEAKTDSKELPLDGALHLTLFDLWVLPFSRTWNGKKRFRNCVCLKGAYLFGLVKRRVTLCDLASC